MIDILRKSVDQQQFSVLKESAYNYYLEVGNAEALPLLALACAHLGELQAAKEYCQQAQQQLTELDLNARVDLAGVYCLFWKIDAACELLEAALIDEPEHSLALARLAWCRLHQGELHDSQALYEQSAQLTPHRLPVWSALVRLALEAEEYEQAQTELDTLIAQLEAQRDLLADDVFALFSEQCRQMQMDIWLGTEQLAQAEQWLTERRVDLSEDVWVKLLVHCVMLLANQEQHDKAEEWLKEGLGHYKANLTLLSQLAELAELQGRTMQAVQLLRRAIRKAEEQEKPTVSYWVRLSNACLHNMEDRARTAAEKAIEAAESLEPNGDLSEPQIKQLILQAKGAMAQVESQAQNYTESAKLFNDLLEENPYFIPALQGLGGQEMQIGNIDKAVELFERIKEINPAKGYSSLINARQFPDDEVTLKRIEKVARGPSLEGKVRSGLLLQLASTYEKRKDYDKAFKLATEANDSSKKRLAYNAEKHRNRCARIRYAFSKELYQHRQDCGHDSTVPVFVLGMPRSGTTLVEQIIASHSDIFGAGELGVIPSRIQGLNRWERHTGSGRSYPDCVDDLSPYVVQGIADDIIKELKELAGEDKPEAKHVVDKLPHNFENIGFIKFLFPNAKIISVRRDPRDIAISNYFTDYQAKYGGMGFAYDLTSIGEQLADHNLLMHHWHQVFPGEILEINYEDVVEDTEKLARQMLEYIGVEWQGSVLAFNELDRPVKTASVWQVRQPIYKTSKAKWKRYEAHLAPLLKGTNAQISPAPIDDMISLTEAGWLQEGVAHYQDGDLGKAEMCFKKMLHHNPEHAAANYMVGLVYCSIDQLNDAIPLLEKALEKCPWQKEWRESLIRAYEETQQLDKADGLRKKDRSGNQEQARKTEVEQDWSLVTTAS